MKETMGQIIRRLRQERGFTQEELAGRVGVTFQAVSKWETDTGMPDISQVVPLATALGVNPDVLFGFPRTDNSGEGQKIIDGARNILNFPVTPEQVKDLYARLEEGLKKHPYSCELVMECLEAGLSLSFPANDTFDAENGKNIYKKCISEAAFIINNSNSATDVLRAHMIMVLLHSAYGNTDAALSHAREFPWRADMTAHKMRAIIARGKNSRDEESACLQTDFLYHFEAMLDDVTDIAQCAYNCGEYEKAAEVLMYGLSLIGLICKDEKPAPRFHVREAGDMHCLLAKAYLKTGNGAAAREELRRMAECDLTETAEFEFGRKLKTPLLSDADYAFYRNNSDFRAEFESKLLDPEFDEIREGV